MFIIYEYGYLLKNIYCVFLVGHTRVPKVYKLNQPLSTWVFRQRAHYRRRSEGEINAMSDKRLKLLKKVCKYYKNPSNFEIPSFLFFFF